MAHYDIVYVARNPSQNGGPSMVELGPIYGDLTWTENLYAPDSIEVTAPTNELEGDLKARLRDLATFPTEIWVYREGNLIQAGPIMGGQIDDKTISLSASGIESYLKYMFVLANPKSFTDEDQADIVHQLIDDWQGLTYGNFGIVINGTTYSTHGVTRTISFDLYSNLYDVVEDLGATFDGFDFWVDPETRHFKFGHPTRGTDLSDTVFLERGISNPNIKFSVAPSIIASVSLGTAKNNDGDFMWSDWHNDSLRETFGRAGHADTYEDGESSFLSAQTFEALEARADPLFHPGPGLIPVDGAEVMDFGPGDSVHYLYDAGLGQQSGVFRVKKKKVTVDKQEHMEVEFV